jgi:hypothetical protein
MELPASAPLSVTATVPFTVGASSAGPGPAGGPAIQVPLMILLPHTGTCPATIPPLSINASGKAAATENSVDRNGRSPRAAGPVYQTTWQPPGDSDDSDGPATAAG